MVAAIAAAQRVGTLALGCRQLLVERWGWETMRVGRGVLAPFSSCRLASPLLTDFCGNGQRLLW